MTAPLSADPTANDVLNAINRRWDDGDVLAQSTRRGAFLQYWRKCFRDGCPRHTDRNSGKMLEKGWVVIGAALSDPMEHARLINSKHWTPLPQYGTMPYGEQGAAGPDNRWQQILEKDGLREFPLDQVLAFGWDKIPTVRAARKDIPDPATFRIPCNHSGCFGRDFVCQADYQTHVKAVHGTSEAADAMGRVFSETMQRTGTGDPTLIATAVAAALQAVLPSILAGQAGPPPEVPHPNETVSQYKARLRRRESEETEAIEMTPGAGFDVNSLPDGIDYKRE